MAWLGDIIGSILLLAGAFFFVVGAVGIYRMPDVFTRMHAAGISDTVGAGLLVLGMMFISQFDFFVTAKLGIILGIIFFTSPIATHAVAQAALHEGLQPFGVGKKILDGPGVDERPGTTARAKGQTRRASNTAPRKTANTSAKRRPARKPTGRAPASRGRTRS